MPSSCKLLLAGLLAVTLLGLASCAAHAATHVQGDIQTCEGCAGHSDPDEALPVSAAPSFALRPGQGSAARRPTAVAAAAPISPRQRAPPPTA